MTDGVFDAGVAGDQDHDLLWIQLTQTLAELDAVQLGHVDVGEHDVELALVSQRQGGRARVRRLHRVARSAEQIIPSS